MVLPQMITEGGLLRTSKAWGEPDFCGLLQFLFLSGLASGPTGFEVIHLHNSDLIFLVGNYASSGALHPFTEIIIFKSPESGYIIQGKYNICCWTSKMSTIKYFFKVFFFQVLCCCFYKGKYGVYVQKYEKETIPDTYILSWKRMNMLYLFS